MKNKSTHPKEFIDFNTEMDTTNSLTHSLNAK